MIDKVQNIIDLLDIAKELPMKTLVQVYCLKLYKTACELMDIIKKANCDEAILLDSNDYLITLIGLHNDLGSVLRSYRRDIQGLELSLNDLIYNPYDLLQRAYNMTNQLFTPISNDNTNQNKTSL